MCPVIRNEIRQESVRLETRGPRHVALCKQSLTTPIRTERTHYIEMHEASKCKAVMLLGGGGKDESRSRAGNLSRRTTDLSTRF